MIADVLAFLREKHGYTMKEVAESIGIKPDTYRSYERGRLQPNLETVSKIADFYKVSADVLLERSSGTSNPLDQLPVSVQDKWIIQAYISLTPAERTELVQLITKIANGADVKMVVNDGNQEVLYPSKQAARNGAPPSTEMMTQAEIDEIESLPDADPDL